MLARSRTFRALGCAYTYASRVLRGDALTRKVVHLKRHAIYFDSFVSPGFPAARGLLATLRTGADKCVEETQSRSLWIERVRQTESSVGSLDDVESFYAKADAQVGSSAETKQYINMMKGGTCSINTFSCFDALKIQESLQRNARTDVLISLTVLDANASNDQCIEFWRGKCDPVRLEALNRLFLEAESRAFQSVSVWIFADTATWQYYAHRHAAFKAWAKDKRVYFYPRRRRLQNDAVALYQSYMRLTDRIWKDHIHASSLEGLS